MSTTKVQMPVKLDEKMVRHRRDANHVKSTACNPTTNNNVPRRQQRFARKRAYSFAGGGGGAKPAVPAHKRRCKYEVRPPTKFLLGGNIYDPLNLNSLRDEAVNRQMNAATPVSSPLPTPRYRSGAIDVIIPPNVHDPLNLLTPLEDDAEYEQNLVSPVKRGRKKHRKKKRNSLSGCSAKENAEGVVVTPSPPPPPPPPPPPTTAAPTPETPVGGGACRNLELALKKDPPTKDNKQRKCSVKDKIVSPVVPQPRVWTRAHGHRPNANKHHQKPPPSPQAPNFKAKNAKYQYGNYNRYYGYRNQNQELDARLKVFFEKRSLFADKDVLDIGCNVGHITLSVARDLGARSVVGLDIDRQLVDVARKNVRHYVNNTSSPTGPEFYPISMPIVFGPVDVPGVVGESPVSSRKTFPDNVSFVQGSYVLDSDTLLAAEHAQFDLILCLSVTKWIHVNWGDAGLRQAFRRMFAQLRPGGRLILEAQGWESYRKRKTLTETIYKNYAAIRFFPQKFTEFLLSEVGFSTCEILATPCHPSKGFQRPIQMFTKGSFSSTYSAPNTPFRLSGVAGGERRPVYTPVVDSTRSVEEEEGLEGAAESGDGSCRLSCRVGRVPDDAGGSRHSEGVPEDTESSRHSEGVPEDESRDSQLSDRAGLDTFRGVVCVTDETRASDLEESCSASSLVTDASHTETQDSV